MNEIAGIRTVGCLIYVLAKNCPSRGAIGLPELYPLSIVIGGKIELAIAVGKIIGARAATARINIFKKDGATRCGIYFP